jgi:CBS domain-containing protein
MAVESEEIDIGKNLPATSLEIDFALVLSRVIGAIKDDPAQLRNAVYELARIKLQKEAWQRDPPLNVLEMRRLLLTLESAIERVETISSRHDELRALQSLDRLLENSEIGSRKMMIEPREPLLIINQVPTYRTADSRPAFLAPVKRAPPSFAWLLRWPAPGPLLRGTIIGIFALALSAVLGHQFGLFGRQVPQPAAPMVQKMDRLEPKSVVQTPATMLRPAGPGFPLPDVYGVYAVSGGKLHELEALVVGRVPDQRVFMSTPIKTPSRTVLPDGRVVFIVYRRDVVRSAPERLIVRVIAKIRRAMTFNPAGQGSQATVDDSWTIRNVSYDFRVAPLSESPEMLMIRPENVDFEFRPGRYGLVFKDQAYDFTVAGQITDAAQCLERVEAANGTFYSECRGR